jgi:cysteine protease ATG4
MFSITQTLGCIGGKPNHAHFFIGYLESDELLYLDPHVTQSHADTTVLQMIHLYHCDRVNRMKITSLDPSLAFSKEIFSLVILFDEIFFCITGFCM